MNRETTTKDQRRTPLTRERVLKDAMRLADEGGIEALSMRKLGQELGVEAMALYHHFANKEALLDGIVDLVHAEVKLPMAGEDWRSAMLARASSIMSALQRHPWAATMMESQHNPGPASLRHHDTVIGCLRGAGFSTVMTAHAYSLLDSYIYGFAQQQVSLAFDTQGEINQVAEQFLSQFPAREYPNLAEFTLQHVMKPGYNYSDEFEFGINLVLDSLEKVRI